MLELSQTKLMPHFPCFRFGLVGGIGTCIVRESSSVVLGEYFRRRRQFVEQVVLAGTGVGVTLFSLLYLSFTRHLDWAQGFQIGAALATICILLPAFYRTAARFHPNRAGASTPQRKVSFLYKILLFLNACGW